MTCFQRTLKIVAHRDTCGNTLCKKRVFSQFSVISFLKNREFAKEYSILEIFAKQKIILGFTYIS
jgi:hypothetical protein